MSDEDYEQGFSEGYDQGLSTDKEKSFLILAARIDELKKDSTRLRADLAAVTEERDRMREALRPFSDAASIDDYIDDVELAETDTARKITFGDLRRARAAIEGVTEPATGDSNA